jgi:ferric-dicitrate binding protein FerR (iron transport regulator)
VEPHHQYPHNPPAGQVQVPPLPAWARVFRTILLVLAGLLVVMLLLLFVAGTSASADMYTQGGRDILQVTSGSVWERS